MPAKHSWTFKARLRSRAFGRKGSHPAGLRLKEAAAEIKKIARVDPVTQRAKELEAVGCGVFDALHLSGAEAGIAEVPLPTGDRFIKRAARGAGLPRVRVLNPVEWLREQEV